MCYLRHLRSHNLLFTRPTQTLALTSSTHMHTHTHTQTHARAHTHTHSLSKTPTHIIYRAQSTGWPRCVGCLNLQVSFRKRATNCRSLFRKMTYKDKAFYGSSPPCNKSVQRQKTGGYTQKSHLFFRSIERSIARRSNENTYGVATISRLLKIIGLFCKRALEKR